MTIAEVPLNEETLACLIGLSRDWESENSTYGYRANQREDIEGNRIFLAKEQDRIIGYLFGHGFKSESMRSIMPEGTPCFEVEELYVIPAFRSRGIGSALFGWVADLTSIQFVFQITSFLPLLGIAAYFLPNIKE